MSPSFPLSPSSSFSEKARDGDGPPFLHSAGRSLQSLTANILSFLPFPPLNPSRNTTKKSPPPPLGAAAPPVCPSLCTSSSPPCSSAVTVPLLLPFSSASCSSSSDYQSQSRSSATASPSSAIRSLSPGVKIEGLSSSSKGGGGPAFVGQVFSMLDPSGNGLMAVTTHFDIPFLSKRTPEWIKKMLATVTKSERKGPVFRFFMDLSDAVAHVKRLNIPTGMVGACRLDVAYEHFKEKPHMFQFVPNEKQVKAANKLLRRIPQKRGKRKIGGVPVFTARNLNIAIATNDGIKWYTPYFFDKSLLDNILEASVDQHFHTLIQNRHRQRRRDVIDDGLAAEVVEENGDSLFEPPEVQEVLDELGHSGIPLSVISKAAEIQLLDVADKILLGNKWLRKATGIQPKFPYMVDTFEERSAASFSKATVSIRGTANLEGADNGQPDQQRGASGLSLSENAEGDHGQSTSHTDFQFPPGSWFSNPWSKKHGKQQIPDNKIKSGTSMDGDGINEIPLNPLLPKITMVGISVGDGGQMSRASLKKTMEDLTKELEQASQKPTELNEDKDPLFVANVGDYSTITRMASS
ncbi:uncharacterized protein LOC103712700 [Phoenix dactylifera]|uniref:Uncharacterized protein LOC103712700 n=1 Tax=Phoenix dactylifera TaxID=42345 RepID=A0A8B7CEI8_PHODC|nr:uncharacterized protein LOC103712700 [Phoenix dactylifera]